MIDRTLTTPNEYNQGQMIEATMRRNLNVLKSLEIK